MPGDRDTYRRRHGYYVLKWGGGQYTSVAWYAKREDAEREVARIKMTGAWQGMPPKVEGYVHETAVQAD